MIYRELLFSQKNKKTTKNNTTEIYVTTGSRPKTQCQPVKVTPTRYAYEKKGNNSAYTRSVLSLAKRSFTLCFGLGSLVLEFT